MNHKILFLGVVLLCWACPLAESACNINCSSCSDCTTKISAASAGQTICLTTDLIDVGDCIYNPTNFNNKIFDCQGHIIDGSGGGCGIFIYTGTHTRNTIQNCIITDYAVGIYLRQTTESKILSNNISRMNDHGILLVTSSNYNEIQYNNISDCDNDGISIQSSTFNEVYYNNIASCENGIFLFQAGSTQLYYNIVCFNTLWDIRVSSTSGATGDENTCNKTASWNDIGTTGCTYNCTPTPPTPNITTVFRCSEINFTANITETKNFTVNETRCSRCSFANAEMLNASYSNTTCNFTLYYINGSHVSCGFVPDEVSKETIFILCSMGAAAIYAYYIRTKRKRK